MPCYQVQTCSCSLEKADIDLLKKALIKQGWTVNSSSGSVKSITFSKGGVTGSYRNNKMEFQYASASQKPDTDAIKVAYSKECINQKAIEYAEDGWEMEMDGEEYVFRKNPGYGAVHA